MRRVADEKNKTWTDGYPIKDATHIALETTRQFLEQDDTVRRASLSLFPQLKTANDF